MSNTKLKKKKIKKVKIKTKAKIKAKKPAKAKFKVHKAVKKVSSKKKTFVKLKKVKSLKKQKPSVKKIFKKLGKKGGRQIKDEKTLILEDLISKGRERSFITQSEILKALPNVEKDISLLEELYDKLFQNNIEVVENQDFINSSKEEEVSRDELEKLISAESLRTMPDNVQSYLTEIGKIPLLTTPEEREIAKKCQMGDEEARQKMIQANLRLVVSIAKK
jgi:RNA polymerase primary sigma factor